MPLTKEDRVALLAKAREAKRAKADAKKAEKLANPLPKGRPKKVVDESKTLELQLPVEPDPEKPESEVEIIEEVIYEPKVKKKKKKIVRKIVRQESSSESEAEVEEQIVYEKKPKKNYQKQRPEKIEREVDITQSTPQFNFFGD